MIPLQRASSGPMTGRLPTVEEALRETARMRLFFNFKSKDPRDANALVAAFRRAAERPEVRIEKRPSLRLKQGAWALVGEHGAILKRGGELQGILAPLERRLLRLVED